MKKGIIALAALSAVAFGATASMAENRAGAVNITPVIGGYHWDGLQGVDANLLLGIKAGYNITDRFGIEGLLHYVHTKEWSTGSGKSLDMANYRVELLYHLFPKSTLVPFLALGGGGLHSRYSAYNTTAKDGVISYGAGAKYALSDNLALRADARMLTVVIDPSVRYNYEYTLGLNFQLGGTSRAVAPAAAAAPKAAPAAAKVEPKPEPKPEPKVEPAPAPKPVPPPQQAAAPKLAPAAPVAVAVVPQPAPAPTATLAASPLNIEHKGSTTLKWSSQNATDCNILPGIGPVQPVGSMTVAPAATTNYKLACKGKGGTAESSVNVGVAAPVLDSDKDGVPDNLDKCPNTSAGAKVDSDGCPIVECKSVTLSITFDTGKAVIKENHHQELNMVADKLHKFANSTTVIEGHTDNVGSAAANNKLSQKRAESVRDYIVKTFGIDGSRITAKGYGPSKPVASNKTENGRSKNRRVEAVFSCQ